MTIRLRRISDGKTETWSRARPLPVTTTTTTTGLTWCGSGGVCSAGRWRGRRGNRGGAMRRHHGNRGNGRRRRPGPVVTKTKNLVARAVFVEHYRRDTSAGSVRGRLLANGPCGSRPTEVATTARPFSLVSRMFLSFRNRRDRAFLCPRPRCDSPSLIRIKNNYRRQKRPYSSKPMSRNTNISHNTYNNETIGSIVIDI